MAGSKSARRRAERDTVREAVGSDCVMKALRKGKPLGCSISKKRSPWEVLNREGTWSDKVLFN